MLKRLFIFTLLVVFTAPALSEMVVEPTQKRLILEVNKGKLLKLSGNAGEVFIADPEIADIQVKSPQMVYVFGKKPGDTVIYAVSNGGEILLNKPISVNHNLSRLSKTIEKVVPNTGVQLSSLDGAIVLSGDVGNATEAADIYRLAVRTAGSEDEVINQLKLTGANQVNLRVRIAEVSRQVINDLGVNWDAALSSGSFLFGVATGNPVGVAGALTRNNATNSLFGSLKTGAVDLNVLMDALEAENLITVLAEPNLTALSGETATFLAGGEFPVPVAQGNNNNLTIEFKDFGVSLAFTPTIVGGNRINLKVRPEVSQLSDVGAIQLNNITVPALSTRRAETTVELGSGQSFAIAGLIQQTGSDQLKKVPGLGSLPILGALFRSKRFQKNETELVIVVTPYVVKPVSAMRVVTPADAYTKKSVAKAGFVLN